MNNPLERNGTSFARISEHDVVSIVARREPAAQQARAYADLAEAIPPRAAFDAVGASVETIVTTPDFHSGKPVPVGVVTAIRGAVLPHVIGNDIGCGMRMLVVHGATSNDILQSLDGHLRHIYFQGGRDIALTGHNRHALLREGLPGLLESMAAGRKGLLEKLDGS